MLFSLLAGSLAAFSILEGASVNGLPTLSIKGTKFYDANGNQFFIKGVAYQLSPDDPLQDPAQCQRDANLMKELGTNAIRVYHVSDGDHSGCMSVFDEAGIYLFVDLDTFSTQINQQAPTWDDSQRAAFEAVMDDFQQYDNTAGFFIGNEVLTEAIYSEAAVYIKAATRDMKAYRASKGYRDIPIGYSHADISVLRPNLQNYLACGGNSSENIEFFGLNAYEWCGSNTYQGSGYATLTSQLMDYPIPALLSETGCIKPEPRLFQDQSAVFGPEMTPYWSGAIVYEWIQEANGYGLITYGGNQDSEDIDPNLPVTRSGTPTPVTPDFANLLSVWSTVSPSSTAMADYSPTNPNPVCPSYTASTWMVQGNVALPTLGQQYNSAVQYSITNGAGSVPSGTESEGSGGTSATGASSTSTHRSSAASRPNPVGSGSAQVLGVMVALGCVMLGFVFWL